MTQEQANQTWRYFRSAAVFILFAIATLITVDAYCTPIEIDVRTSEWCAVEHEAKEKNERDNHDRVRDHDKDKDEGRDRGNREPSQKERDRANEYERNHMSSGRP